MSARCLGGVSEVSGRCPGDVWEASVRRLWVDQISNKLHARRLHRRLVETVRARASLQLAHEGAYGTCLGRVADASRTRTCSWRTRAPTGGNAASILRTEAGKTSACLPRVAGRSSPLSRSATITWKCLGSVSEVSWQLSKSAMITSGESPSATSGCSVLACTPMRYGAVLSEMSVALRATARRVEKRKNGGLRD